MLIAAALLLLTTIAFRPKAHDTNLHGTTVEMLYAPFDSIRTDMSDYIWPTSARPKITSSFAEFRSSHFHAGIDIGTNNRIGADVYASRDGYVAWIATSPYGYGRHLAIRHPDGYYTTYGHLSALKEDLERAVHAEQQKQGRFSVEMKFQPGEYPVRQGEVVAYSGESGTGKAHLHFEIRDENFNPVNPLLFPNIRRFTDTEPPIMQRLAVSPADENSFVDYEFGTKVYRAHARTKSSFVISEVIRGTGALGFSIDAADRVNNTRYRSSVYSFEFKVDGTTIFTSQRKRFPEEETRQVGVDFDWALWKEHRGRFQKLYVYEGNTLPFYNRLNQFDGVVALKDFAEGLHRFAIVASDYSGNRSELTGMFVLNHPPTVELIRSEEKRLIAHIPHSEQVATVDVGVKSFVGSEWRSQTYKASAMIVAEDSLSLPFSATGTDIVRVIAKNAWGTRSFPAYFFVRQPHGSDVVTMSTEVDGSFLRIWIESKSPFTAVPSLQVEQGSAVTSVPLRAIGLTEYTGVYKLSGTFSGTSHLKAFCEVAGKRSEVFDAFTLNTITPQQGGTVQSDDGNFSVTFDPGAVFAPLHPLIEKVSPTRYDIEPRDVLMKGGINALFRYPEEKASDEKLALYVNSGGGWQYLHADRDANSFTFKVRDAHTLGSFGVLNDTQRPTIGRWHANSMNVRGRPLFSFSVRDNLSGIDDDEINVLMNGERVIPEYDPERRIVFYIPMDPLPRGRYTVQVEVKDRAGNAARLTKTLTMYR